MNSIAIVTVLDIRERFRFHCCEPRSCWLALSFRLGDEQQTRGPLAAERCPLTRLQRGGFRAGIVKIGPASPLTLRTICLGKCRSFFPLDTMFPCPEILGF